MNFNYLFLTVVVIAFVVYFYYKTKQFRSTLPIRKKWYKAKAGIALGIFIIAFGINAVIIHQSLVSYIICALFVLIGLMQAYSNFSRMRHEGKFVQEEYELNR
ncbi:YtpI-like protein OS=Ureibacillus acetophenoni OX=614649 GN=SAMN05877842_102500 PE=4 SV=1 [Ureibacillus acetophenoni]